MHGSGFDTLARTLTLGHSRRRLTQLVSRVAVAGPLFLLGRTAPVVAVGKKKRKKRLPSPDCPSCRTCPTCPSGMTDLGNGS